MFARRREVVGSRVMFTAAIVCALAGTALAQSPVYTSGFENGAIGGWSTLRTFSARSGGTLLGRFHNEGVTLTLDKLPAHSSAVVAFDLHVIGQWTGENGGAAPTTLTVTLDDGTLLCSSLANESGDPQRRQSFPSEPGEGSHPAALGAYKVNTLGLISEAGRPETDSVYRMVFTAPHAGASLKLRIAASNLPGTVKEASWAVDNAVIYTTGDGVDVDAVRTAARDAVLKTSLGMPVDPIVPAAVEPLVQPSAHGLIGHGAVNFGALDAAVPSPAPISTGSFLAAAMDSESRIQLPVNGPDSQLALGVAREYAVATPGLARELEFVPALPVLPSSARIEQPVMRRVSGVVYQSRFSEAPGKEWDKGTVSVSPRGEKFIGPFANEAATLKLGDLPPHDQLIIDTDLYTVGDWPGDGADPSKFVFTIDGQPVLAETFANDDGTQKRTQSYPSGGGKARMPGADAAAIDSLGFAAPGSERVGDSVYHLRFVVPHTSGSAALKFAASGLPKGGATWGLDNMAVVASGNRVMSYSEATGLEPDDNADDGDYMNPFVRPIGPEWNVQTLEKSPSGEMFLGKLHNQTAALTVKNFPQHTHLTVAADVAVIGDWQGNNAPDPSRFKITLSDGSVVFATSFASDNGAPDATQDYPASENGKNLPGAGAYSVGSLGYKDPVTGKGRDAVYRLFFTVPHTAASETISFTVSGLRGDGETASWGLDNVSVSSVDSKNPMGYASGGGTTALGDAGLQANANTGGGGFDGGSHFDPLGSNPYIPTNTAAPFPHLTDGGGGGGNPPPPPPPVTPSPGTLPALIVGGLTAVYRRRR